MRSRGGIIFSAFCSIALAACATNGPGGPGGPDLVVDGLSVDPAETTAGTSITINSAIRNAGAGPTQGPAALNVDLYKDDVLVTGLTSWRQADNETLAAGATVEDSDAVRTPDLQAGAYSICAIADPSDEISESDESNNRSCTPLSVVAGAPRRADLVIEKITPAGQVEASLKVIVKIKNAGSGEAGPFRVMAFRRNPRAALLLIECPLTEGQLSSGSPASCDDLSRRTPLAAGESVELTGYFSYVAANGASFVRVPIGPGNPNPLVRREVDFMVDGCYPPTDGSPVYCAVDEIDELNNFKGAALRVR